MRGKEDIMNKEIIAEYHNYINKIGNRKPLYKVVVDEYDIKTAIYPGSHIDITPSLVIPKVIYIDNFKGTINFFNHIESIKEYLKKNSNYSVPCKVIFLDQDYNLPLNIKKVDLIISQYAGFVGQATKDYLKVGGILLCNDSHGDASLANLDDDFKLIGIIDNKNKIQKQNLGKYFILPKEKPINIKKIKENMQGLKYKNTANNYLFRKLK